MTTITTRTEIVEKLDETEGIEIIQIKDEQMVFRVKEDLHVFELVDHTEFRVSFIHHKENHTLTILRKQ